MKLQYIFRKFASTIIILAIIFTAFGFGVFVGQESQRNLEIQGLVNQDFGKPEGVDFSIFWEAWKKAEEKFIGIDALDYQKMIYGAIKGMIESFNDPYTIFMDPQESKRFIEDVSGKFEGIGAELGMKRDILTIIAPLKNTPAERAGLRPGDKILKIDAIITADLTIDEAVNLIRGPKGTKVKLTIARDDGLETKEIMIERAVIEIPSLKLSSVSKDGELQELETPGETAKTGIAYLSLYQFSQESVGDFQNSVQEILKSGAKGIILDLRNNPGGYLEVAETLASFFLQKNSLIAIEEFSDGTRKEYRASGNPLLLSFPVVVLINGGSASASEILAGALRENRNIILVGETTFGKGSIQELEKLRDGSSLKITVAKWLTPSGKALDEKGLEPDIKIEMTPEDYEEGKDPQLKKAIEILNSF